MATDPTLAVNSLASVPTKSFEETVDPASTEGLKKRIAELERENGDLKRQVATCGGAHGSVAAESSDQVKTMSTLNVEPGTGVVIEIGLHSQMLAPMGPKSFILGVEASLDSIIDNMGPFRNVPQTAIVNAAMFDRDGLSVFQEMGNWSASNTLVVGTKMAEYDAKFKITKQSPVATLKLEHLIDSILEHSRLDLLKVDVQGVNYNVLKSAGQKILRARSVFTECTTDNVKPSGHTAVDIYGNVEDKCTNIRKYMEGMGFVYLGLYIEGEDDASGDIVLVHKQYLEHAKPCIKGDIGGTLTKDNENTPICLAKAMAKA